MCETVNGKSEKFSFSDKIKLSIISLVHHELGSRKETYLPMPRVRLQSLLYLSDLEWHRQKEETYLGAWVYANGGPLLQDFDNCLKEIDGLEITKKNNGYIKGPFSRFSSWKIAQNFDSILLDLNRQFYFYDIAAIEKLVYASPPMQNANFGDYLFSLG